MELLIMAYALKTACARNIIGVIPYFPYSKQSKMRKRGSIVCKLLASMLAKAGECEQRSWVPALDRASPCCRSAPTSVSVWDLSLSGFTDDTFLFPFPLFGRGMWAEVLTSWVSSVLEGTAVGCLRGGTLPSSCHLHFNWQAWHSCDNSS